MLVVVASGAAQTQQGAPPAIRQATVLIVRGKFDEARTMLDTHRRAHPDDAYAVFVYGLSFHRQKRYTPAREHFERALEMGPESRLVTTHHFLGYCLYYLGELEPARRHFRRHLEFDPSEPDSWYGLGLVDLEAGAFDRAEKHFRTSLEKIDALPEDDDRRKRPPADRAKAHARLGDVHFARGDFEAARAALERAIAIDRDQYPAYYKLSRVHRRLGDDDAAADALRRHAEAKARVRPPADGRP